MSNDWHRGERLVQQRAGVRDLAYNIRTSMPENFQAFARTARLAVAATVSREGDLWASLLTGQPGFLSPLDGRTLRVRALPGAGDPGRIADASEIGLLVFDPSTRRRIRVNGAAALAPGGFDLHAREIYGNCQQYIQKREYVADAAAAPAAPAGGAFLKLHQEDRIRAADTFFIATRSPGVGLDASHRGGNPGFIHVPNNRALLFPDYAGNEMFNTLGNLELDAHAGLLFVDFETGDTLQLSGTARTLWDPAAIAQFPGAQRAVEFVVQKVWETAHASPLRMRLLERSPFNPAESCRSPR